MYFDPILSFPPCSPRSSLTPYPSVSFLPPSSHPFLSQKQAWKKNPQKTRSAKPKEHTQNKTQHGICLVLSMRPAQEVGWSARVTPLEKTQISFSRHLTAADSFLVRGGTLCILPHSQHWNFVWLNLCRPCACFHSDEKMHFLKATDSLANVLAQMSLNQ